MKEVQIQFVKHRTAKAIAIAWARFDYPRMSEENILKQKVGLDLDLGDGKMHPGTVAELIVVIRKCGMWAFCDKITYGKQAPDIHYWVGVKAKKNKVKVMEIFGHEVGHAIGYTSENMAVKFGGVAGFAYMSMMQEIYGDE